MQTHARRASEVEVLHAKIDDLLHAGAIPELDEAVGQRPHSVEYITAGDVPLEVDHVQIGSAEEEALEDVAQ